MQKEERSSYEQVCDSVQKIYISQIGVRELTGHNDGKQVEMYLASVGLSKGYPYCAAGVHWALNKAGVKNTINGSATTSFNIKSPVWYQRRMIETPHSADVVSFFYPSMGRIAHTGFYDREINSSIYESVEFNTNDDGSRDGIGVFRKKRSYNSTYAISRWVKQ